MTELAETLKRLTADVISRTEGENRTGTPWRPAVARPAWFTAAGGPDGEGESLVPKVGVFPADGALRC